MQMNLERRELKGSRKDRPSCDLLLASEGFFSLLSEWASPNGPKHLDLDILTIPLWPTLSQLWLEQTASDASPSGKPKRLRSRQADPISRSMGVPGQ